jgi:ubiquinone/menaquinone biosynthesis C-methylase UbiE
MNTNNLLTPEILILARDAYKKGKNVTSVLKNYLQKNYNTPEIIALAYDLQAGTYTSYSLNNKVFTSNRARELATFVAPYCVDIELVLDLGSGEISMFSRLLAALKSRNIRKAYASDISWSRLNIGVEATKNIVPKNNNLTVFVSEMAKIPLPSKSIDLTFTDHSLEPNGSRLEEIIKEIFRCTRSVCIFTEPCNELASIEAKERMKKLGYIFDLEETIKKLGGYILDRKDIVNNSSNALNPARVLAVRPPQVQTINSIDTSEGFYTFPGTDYNMQLIDGCLTCHEMGVVFPIIKNIPILLEDKLIIASKFN